MSATDAPSTPTLETRTELSLLYRVLRTVIKPLRPRLVKPGSPLPKGSPQLTNHPKTKKGCKIVESRDEESGVWMYDFQPQSVSSSSSTHRILYFAGGGFQSPPSGEHWSLVAKLASTPGLADKYRFTIVSNPLAPNSPAKESLSTLRVLLRKICEDAARDGGKVSLMGDSSGGNLVLSLGFWWALEMDKQQQQESGTRTGMTSVPSSRHVLRNLVVVSPAVDHRNTNPEIKRVDASDPILGYELIESVSRAWCSSSSSDPSATPPSRSDPDISPLLHSPSSFRLLRELGIRVHGAIGTHDVLAPDAELFRRKCVESAVGGEWLVWEGQMHCFVLAGVYGMREGRQGIEWMSEVLKRNL